MITTFELISIVMGAFVGLSLRLQKNYLIRFQDRPRAFLFFFIPLAIARMIVCAIFIYALLEMNYLKSLINGVIFFVVLILVLQNKAPNHG